MPTVKELKQKCKAKGLKGYSKLKKSELEQLLRSRSRSRSQKKSQRKSKSKACSNKHSILGDDIKELPKELVLKLELQEQVFCFNIIALRRVYQIALENNESVINPLDPHKRPIPLDKIKKIKKFWNKLVKTKKTFIQQQLKEYGYDPKNLSWPRAKKKKSIPKGWRLHWLRGHYPLASFWVGFKGIQSKQFYFPNFMDTGMKFTNPTNGYIYDIDTSSTSENAMILINELWDKQKLFLKLNTSLNLKIIKSLKGIDKINYWPLDAHDRYTYQTYKLWIKFLADLKNELDK